MRVGEIRLESHGDGRELSGTVSFDTPGLDSRRLWFRSPVPPSGELDGSPFLPALLHLSMHLHEPLHIDGPVSPLLLAGAERASLVMRSWWPRLAEARVSPAEAATPSAGAATGVFFTRGVDSWHSALETLVENEGEVRLLGWPGADLRVYQAGGEGEAASAAALRDAAPVAGAPLDTLASNVRGVVNPYVHWGECHGGLLAALALAHGGLAEARMASALPLGNLVPAGTHPLLDPLWSTEATRIVHHAPEMTRTDKIASLSRRPDVLATLKACDYAEPRRNCGECDKCVRTMIGFELAGALAQAPFDAPLSSGRILRLGVSTSLERAFSAELLEACSRTGRRDLSEPLQIAIAADYARRAAKRARVVARRWLWRKVDRISSRAG